MQQAIQCRIYWRGGWQISSVSVVLSKFFLTHRTQILQSFVGWGRHPNEVHVVLNQNVFIYNVGYIASVEVMYGVAKISRLIQIIGLFCRILSLLQGSFAKETYNNVVYDASVRQHQILVWGGYDQQAHSNYRSVLQNVVSFIGLFCKRDLQFWRQCLHQIRVCTHSFKV